MNDPNKDHLDPKDPMDPKDPKRPNRWVFGIAALVVAYLLYSALSPDPVPSDAPGIIVVEGMVLEVSSFPEALSAVETDSAVKAVVTGHDTWGNPSVTVEREGKRGLIAGVPPGGYDKILTAAKSRNIETDGTVLPPIKPPTANPGTVFWILFLQWGPMVLFIGFIIWMFKNGNPMQSKNSQPKHRMVLASDIKETLADFAGNEETKEDVEQYIDFLRDPKRLVSLGGSVPRGVLMVGPPGNGKTLLARCIAGEAKVPFFTVSGSDFVEMFVGVGASRVRKLFEDAAAHAPCIIFIDEIDAIGGQRGASYGGGNDEREQTLNQLLVEMDGFDQRVGIFVIAATNRADVLDKALLREGRFDQQVTVGLPDLHSRKKILEVHMKGKKLGEGVSIDHIANSSWGFSGAQLKGLLNRATILLFRKMKDAEKRKLAKVEPVITADILERALMEGSMQSSLALGAAKRMDPRVKRMLAYHEGGHGLATEYGYRRWLASGSKWNMQWGMAVRRLTIVGAANTGGHMQATPDMDTMVQSFEALLGDIACGVAATISERMFTGTATTGNYGDLRGINAKAKLMVTKVGMSRLGPLSVGDQMENPNLGAVLGKGSGGYGLSDYSGSQIDHEIARLLAGGARIAIRALREMEPFLHAVVEELLVKETIARAEWAALWDRYEGQRVYVSDEAVEAELQRLWPELARLTSNGEGGIAMLEGEYVEVKA